jgi:multimeric flavodoxin WrbA
MANIIVLFSSSRQNGNTRNFIDQIAVQLETIDIFVEIIDLEQYHFSDFDYEHKNKNDDFSPLFEKILPYPIIIFATPVYWYAVPPQMKRFLDRISDYLICPQLLDKGRQLRGKTAYIVCTSVKEHASETYLNAFKETFAYLGMQYGGYIHADCSEGYQAEPQDNAIMLFSHLFKTQKA